MHNQDSENPSYRQMDRRQFLIRSGEFLAGLGLAAIGGTIIHETFKQSAREKRRKQENLERYLYDQNNNGYLQDRAFWVDRTGEQDQILTFWISNDNRNLRIIKDEIYPDGDVEAPRNCTANCPEEDLVGTILPNGTIYIAQIGYNRKKSVLFEYSPDGHKTNQWEWNTYSQEWQKTNLIDRSNDLDDFAAGMAGALASE
jgi:hypothetical protein